MILSHTSGENTGAHVIKSCTQGDDLNLELKNQQ